MGFCNFITPWSEEYPMKCGAKTRSGGTCQRPGMPNGRCALHGGKSLAGIASPTYQHGRYSRVMPTRMQARYQEAAGDPALLEQRAEVALLDARLADLLGRVDTGESGGIWKQLQEARRALIVARRANDNEGASAAINEMSDLIGRGHADYAAWREISVVLEQRRKLVESERKRLIEMQQTITAEKAMLLIGAIGQIIKTHVTDRVILTKISADIRDLTASEPS
jgi:hypothetical protein